MSRTSPLISQSLPNFINGISQQPFTMRLSSQGERQENGYSTAAQGLKKRPPSQHLGSAPIGSPDMHLHTINRDASERYLVTIENLDLHVYDLNGVAQTVNFPNGKNYLWTTVGSTVQQQFACCSVADYTFITNKNQVVGADTVLHPTRNHEALINVKAGNYSKQYKVYINGLLLAVYTTPDGSLPAHLAQISTDYIALQLFNQLIANGITNAAGWGNVLMGSILQISNLSNTPFGLVVEDGQNNNALVAIKDRVAKFSDLPGYARAYGFTVLVAGDNSSSSDDYWVTYSPNPGSTFTQNDGAGVWKECPAPGTSKGVAWNSMPWTLVREANGTFTFNLANWGQRLAGDTKTNPDLTFVGSKINDVFFYRNRLGFLTDENVCMSEAGEFFNFYRISVITTLDSDPIDAASTSTKVSILKHAVQFNKQLLLFSADSQFIIDEPGILTANTTAIKLASEFPSNTGCRPVVTGRNVYFSVNKGAYSAIREYYVDTNNLQNDAADVTAHVPEWVYSNLVKITASGNEDMIAGVSANDRSVLFIYKYYYSGSEKLMSSWSGWSAGPGSQILGIEMLDSYLYMFVLRPDSRLYFERINLSSITTAATNEPFPVHLDRKVTIPRASLVYDAVNNLTYFTTASIGYPALTTLGKFTAVIANTNPTGKAGTIIPMTSNDAGGTVLVVGDYRGNDLIFGQDYTFRYVLSTITVKQQDATGMKSDTVGRLQLRKIGFNYANSGLFDVNVTPTGRQTFSYRFAGKILGISSVLGAITLPTGNFQVPIMSRNVGTTIELVSTSPLPCSFLSADWEGFYVKRSVAV